MYELYVGVRSDGFGKVTRKHAPRILILIFVSFCSYVYSNYEINDSGFTITLNWDAIGFMIGLNAFSVLGYVKDVYKLGSEIVDGE